MTFPFLFSLVLVFSTPQTEKVVAVSSGERLEVNAINKGEVIISVWEKEEVRVRAYHSPEIRIEVQRSSGLVKVEERRPVRSALEEVRVEVTVPRSFQVRVVGSRPRVTVEGLNGAVNVNTNQGDVIVREVSGSVRLHSSGGRLELKDVRGIAHLKTTAKGISVEGLEGDLEAETVAGDIWLSGLTSSRVKATSHAGNITFQGPAVDGGLYDFASNNGTVKLILSQPLNAFFTVGTVSGDFRCDFPLGGAVPKKGEKFTFAVGGGSAQIELITFRGAILILRP